jgi:hypothetical protein
LHPLHASRGYLEVPEADAKDKGYRETISAAKRMEDLSINPISLKVIRTSPHKEHYDKNKRALMILTRRQIAMLRWKTTNDMIVGTKDGFEVYAGGGRKGRRSWYTYSSDGKSKHEDGSTKARCEYGKWLDHARCSSRVHASLQHLRWHVGADFFGMLVADEVGVAGIVNRRDGLFHGLDWRRRRWRQLAKVFAAVTLNRGPCACTAWKRKFRDALVRRDFGSRNGRRLVARTAGAAHSLSNPFEGHADTFAHASASSAMRLR